MPKSAKLVLLGTGALALFVLMVNGGQPSTKTVDPEQQKREAQEAEFRQVKWACWDAVRNRPKAPKSADFDRVVTGFNKNDSTKIVTVGKVTAQNSFGVNLTKDYGCEYDRNTRTLIQVSISP